MNALQQRLREMAKAEAKQAATEADRAAQIFVAGMTFHALRLHSEIEVTARKGYLARRRGEKR